MNPADTEADLVHLAQTGDHGAFADLLKGHDDKMRGLAYRLLGTQSAMDDALQDAYLKAYRSLGSFEAQSAFGTWLYQIVYRTCLDHLRSRARRDEVGLEVVDEQPVAGIGLADQVSNQHDLSAALRRLPLDQAEALLLVEFEELSYQEAAQVLDVAEGTIASRLNRARTTLRTMLGPDGGNLR